MIFFDCPLLHCYVRQPVQYHALEKYYETLVIGSLRLIEFSTQVNQRRQNNTIVKKAQYYRKRSLGSRSRRHFGGKSAKVVYGLGEKHIRRPRDSLEHTQSKSRCEEGGKDDTHIDGKRI